MCGIVGLISADHEARLATVRAMSAAITHRGPDASGVWQSDLAPLALGHQRLAVVDLSPMGAQPMHSADARFSLVFNGEIYNHLALRTQLASSPIPAWNGGSDTETLLGAVQTWGVDRTLTALTGMFAFALWDASARTLHLVRDRMGEKPLYVAATPAGIAFGSELRAITQWPSFTRRLRHEAVQAYFQHHCVPTPYSIYESCWKLPQASVLSIQLETSTLSAISQHLETVLRAVEAGWPPTGEIQSGGVTLRRYWRLDTTAPHTPLSAPEYVDQLEARLTQAVAGQSMADVPLGAFLSGGIDSALIAALLQKQQAQPIHTFSLGFDNPLYDESAYAKQVALHIGSHHTAMQVTAKDAQDTIALLPQIYDEPFADMSGLPTYLLARLTRQHVTVSLSGDGADELFGGYTRHAMLHRLWPKIAPWPRFLRRAFAAAITHTKPETWQSIYDHLSQFLPVRWQQSRFSAKLNKLAHVLGSQSDTELYQNMMSAWPRAPLLAAPSAASWISRFGAEAPAQTLEKILYLDQHGYLSDDILVKVDRAGMAVSLETRMPFLDHHVVEFAATLPLQYKLHAGEGKWALKQVLYRHVPATLFDRPKMGFNIPLGEWLRHELRPWATTYLSAEALAESGLFDTAAILRLWAEHLSGQRDHAAALWDVLMFEAWRHQWLR